MTEAGSAKHIKKYRNLNLSAVKSGQFLKLQVTTETGNSQTICL